MSELKAQLCKSQNWKAPGIDKVPNYWVKNIPFAHTLLTDSFNCYVLNPESLPAWVTKGRTVLLPKSRLTHDPKQYRPITCLTTTWKALTGIIASKIENHLNQYGIVAEEQLGASRGSCGPKHHLMINKSILELALRNKRNLSMLYVDYQKAYDSVPHGWILEALRIYKVSSVIVNFLEKTMVNWCTDLFLYFEGGVIEVSGVQIRRGIFQGDSLSPLLFIIALNPLSTLLNRRCRGFKFGDITVSHLLYMDDLKGFCENHVEVVKMAVLIDKFSSDIGMCLGLKKCNVINIRGRKLAQLGAIKLDDGREIAELTSGEFYKYLGVEELVNLNHDKMKSKILKEVKKKLRLVLSTELNSKNLVIAMNETIIPVLSYSFGVIDWTEGEIQGVDITVRKFLNMFKALEIKSDVDRLYVSRENGGGVLCQCRMSTSVL